MNKTKKKTAKKNWRWCKINKQRQSVEGRIEGRKSPQFKLCLDYILRHSYAAQCVSVKVFLVVFSLALSLSLDSAPSISFFVVAVSFWKWVLLYWAVPFFPSNNNVIVKHGFSPILDGLSSPTMRHAAHHYHHHHATDALVAITFISILNLFTEATT